MAETGAADHGVLHELVKPHIQSFDFFVEHGLHMAALGLNPVQVTQPATRMKLRLWIEKPVIGQPMKDEKDKSTSFDQRLQPMECRQAGLTYQGHLTADVCFQWNEQTVMRFNMSFGRIPVMVMSSICHLRGLDRNQLIGLKEEASEVGGYFICNGHERVIRLLIVMKHNHALAVHRGSFKKRGPSFTDMGVMMRCVRRDQSCVFTRLHYLQHGSAAVAFLLQKQEYVIPVGIVLKALSNTQDKEIYDLLTCVYQKENEGRRGSVSTHLMGERALIILEETRKHGLHTRLQCLQYIGERFRPVLDGMETEPAGVVGEKVIEDYILVHLNNPFDKFNILIFMLQKLFALADKKAAPDNVDALQNQEILLPGHLLTFYVKDRMQQWLLKVKGALLKEMEDKPNEFDLQDRKKVQKVLDKVSSSDIGKRVEYLLKSGNLVLQQGIDNLQTSGYTVAAERLNYLRYISHFRSVHRGSYFQAIRTTTVRKLLPESWGFLCPVHTPDGAPCGLLNHLTSFCQITSDLDSRGIMKDHLRIRKDITSVLSSLGMNVIPPQLSRAGPPEFLTVILDGRVIGQMHSARIPAAVAHLRHQKILSNSDIPSDLEIAYVPCTFFGAYPGIFLFTTSARMIRPVKQLMKNAPGDNVIEMIGPMEQVYMEISCPDSGSGGRINHSKSPTHAELHPMVMLSIVAGLTPWSDHNQSPRNMYQCQMGKQTMGFPSQNIQFHSDSKLYRLQTPQTPIARTIPYLKYHMDEFPTGTNAVVAVISYTGYDMEDAMIINKASMERGLCHGQIYKTETIDLTNMRQRGDGIVNVFGRGKALSNLKFLDADGLPYIGQRLEGDDPYCSVLNTVTGFVKLSKLRASETAVVDSVALVRTGRKDPLQKVIIRLRQERNPVIGDKFSSRHGQKGVCSQLWPDIDMPFSSVTGMQPDIIINPHAFPSRMTIGMLLESIASKGGAIKGRFIDATPFQNCTDTKSSVVSVVPSHVDGSDNCNNESLVDKFGEVLRDYGFNYHGTEVMYSGILGTELTCEIFMGIVYYQRLRHMVSDKFQVRSTGAVNPVTQQPVKGRSIGGGIRFGEMERDALLAHGAAYLLHDRMHTCSDYHIANVCSLCGSLFSPVTISEKQVGQGSGLSFAPIGGRTKKSVCRYCKTGRNIERVAMPFAFRYLAAELAAMNIKLTLQIAED